MRSDTENLGQLLGGTSRAWRFALDRRLQPLGLSLARWLVLLHLANTREPLSQKGLAARVGVEGPTLVGLLDRMESDGWVSRRPSDTDRRSKHVVLTSRAKEVIRPIRAAADELREELLRGLSEEEIETCRKVLEHIKQAANRINVSTEELK
ncbi:MAG: MarR family transcriptional regulator [Arenicellales bacterium]